MGPKQGKPEYSGILVIVIKLHKCVYQVTGCKFMKVPYSAAKYWKIAPD